MNRYDVATAPLHGANLIEASAGTGKTFNITLLYLRLIAESNLSASEILVVTFTNAATAELCDKIRDRLTEALTMLRRPINDIDAAHPVGKVLAPLSPTDAAARIEAAISQFDKAAIYSIHGFCHRLINDYAFQNGVDFDFELSTDSAPFEEQLAARFYLRTMLNSSPIQARYLIAAGFTVSHLTKLAHTALSKPEIHFDPATPSCASAPEETFNAALDAVRACLNAESADIRALLLAASADKTLNQNSCKPAHIEKKLHQLVQCIGAPGLAALLHKDCPLEYFSTAKILKNTKKGFTPPHHHFFGLIDNLMAAIEAMDNIRLQAQWDFIAFIKQEAPRQKQMQQVFFFDDLQQTVDSAVRGPGGSGLKQAIANRFKAAMVDEFQDTDAVQYRIFSQLFAAQQIPFFMIGDPKQAIYAFRGGDIFTYMQAANAVDKKQHRFTLDTNWRSGPGLINCINTLFQSRDNAFGFEEIPFHPVAAAPGKDDLFQVTGQRQSPFQVLFIERTATNCGKKNTKKPRITATDGAFLERMVDDIISLLGGQASLDGNPVTLNDVAVLVRTNDQATDVVTTLNRRGVPTDFRGNSNVFQSNACAELYQLMSSIAAPWRTDWLQAALTTRALNYDGVALAADPKLDARLQSFQEKWHTLQQTLADRGLPLFFKELQLLANVDDLGRTMTARIKSQPDGARYLTDLQHTMELLQRDMGAGPCTIIEAVDALQQFICDAGSANNTPDAAALRPATDAPAVTIITIHKSKGLQYPIVYLPYLFKTPTPPSADALICYHHRDAEYCNLSQQNPEAKAAYLAEQQAEDLRLLYVALTRAEHVCKVLWGAFRKFETSNFARLIHPLDPATVSQLDDTALLAQLHDFARRCGEASVVAAPAPAGTRYDMPVESSPGTMTVRSFPDHYFLPPPPIQMSFSYLASAAHNELDFDEPAVVPAIAPPTDPDTNTIPVSAPTAVPEFDKGVRFGQFVHHFMEHLSFESPDIDIVAKQCRRSLSTQQYVNPDWAAEFPEWILQILRTPLSQNGPCLNQIADEQRHNELDFIFPVSAPISLAALAAPFCNSDQTVLQQFGAQLINDSAQSAYGFMVGSIDLLFKYNGQWFIADYKTNFLGTQSTDYSLPRLQIDMAHHRYYLQYHLYTLALTRQLKKVDPSFDYTRDFGGTFYLYLRGMDGSSPNTGVFFDKPPATRIAALASCLAADGGDA